MRTIYAKDHGILPGGDAAKKLNGLLAELKGDKEEKVLVLEEGEYFLDSDNVPEPFLYITNTIGDNEWKDGETPHKNRVGLFFDGIENLTLEGNKAVFIAKGQMTNLAARDCRGLTVKNIVFRAENPDMHALKVVKKGLGYVDFRPDDESVYTEKDGKYYFEGKGFRTPITDSRLSAHWIGKIPAEDESVLFRTSHPLRGAFSIKEKGNRLFRARYVFPPLCKEGDEYYLFDVRRKYQGIFAADCIDIAFEGIEQRFNYGLASVFQACENVSVKNCVFAPDPHGSKKMASVADFMQICCCRGKAEITDNFFMGAGDDCLNVHGVHFAVKEINGKNVTVEFRHPQSHGFCPFRQGDAVRFIDPATLLPVGHNRVESASLINEREILITLKREERSDKRGMVVENADACPDLVFARNTLDRIITRGLLITTSGKVVVKDNDFRNTSMNAILVSDDAKSWYESGFVTDVSIENNRFYGNEGYYICVKPENSRFEGYVHRGIKAENNYFASPKSKGLYFKAAGNAVVKNNEFVCGKKIKAVKSAIEKDI